MKTEQRSPQSGLYPSAWRLADSSSPKVSRRLAVLQNHFLIKIAQIGASCKHLVRAADSLYKRIDFFLRVVDRE